MRPLSVYSAHHAFKFTHTLNISFLGYSDLKMAIIAVQVSTYQKPQKIWIKLNSCLFQIEFWKLAAQMTLVTYYYCPLHPYPSHPPYFLLDGGMSITGVYLEFYLTHRQSITFWFSCHCLDLTVLLLASASVIYLNSLIFRIKIVLLSVFPFFLFSSYFVKHVSSYSSTFSILSINWSCYL